MKEKTETVPSVLCDDTCIYTLYTADFRGFWNYIYIDSTKLYIARNP